jgi:hypothetical protein
MAKTLAEDFKWRVVLLYSDGYLKKQIAKLLYIGETLVNKIIHIYAKWGCVVNPWRRLPGRKKVFSSSDMNVRIIWDSKIVLFVVKYVLIILLYIRYYVKLYVKMLIIILMNTLKKCKHELENVFLFQLYGDH